MQSYFIIHNQDFCGNVEFLYIFPEPMHFENYREFLLYHFNSLVAEGKPIEILQAIKAKPRGQTFDFELNTLEGK